MRHLATGICSEKCVIRGCRSCANLIECIYTDLLSIRPTTRLGCVALAPRLHAAALNTVGSFNTVVSICVFKHIETENVQ